MDGTPELFAEVYDELRRVAHGYLRGGRAPVTLQATAIVHEAYLKLVSADAQRWHDRGHFCAVATRAIRQILIDHCRRRVAAKRGGGSEDRVTLSGIGGPGEGALVDLLALHEALDQLERHHARMAQIVELRVFGGLTGAQIAAELAVSLRTVEADWRRARAWLAGQLGPGWRFD